MVIKYNEMEELINILLNTKNNVVNNFEKNNPPRIFVVGKGKSGTTSLTYGFKKEIVAHWHTKKTLYSKYKVSYDLIKKLEEYDIYDIVLYIGKKYKFKPLIIETIREPISRKISKIFHNLVENSDIKTVQKFVVDKINLSDNDINGTNIKSTCNKWNEKFGINLCKTFNIKDGYFYSEIKNVKLLFLKYELLEKSNKIINKLGYDFKLPNNNITIERKKFNNEMKNMYIKLRNGELIEIKGDILQKIYHDSYIKYFYSENEILTFKIKYGYQ